MTDVTSDEEKYESGYKAGIIAAHYGKTESDNPYYANTPQWRGWLKGLQDASKPKT